jgi:predicted acylesterase/phospholipase RssA
MVTSSRTKQVQKKKIGRKSKIAFVCSGGATKAGAFHLGVALALQEKGFRFIGGIAPKKITDYKRGPLDVSVYVGSSAGSMITTYLSAGFSLENIFHSFLNLTPEGAHHVDFTPKKLPRLTYQKMFRLRSEIASEQMRQFLKIRGIFSSLADGNWESLLQFKWLKTTGVFSTEGLEQYLREDVLLSNHFQDYLAELYITSTRLDDPRKVVFGKRAMPPPPHDPRCLYLEDVKISDACAASMALPFIFAPHPLRSSDGVEDFYIDGETRDTLSTHVAVDAGADLVISSYTHQPYHFHPEMGSLTKHGLPSILVQSLYILVEQKINRHIHQKKGQQAAMEAVQKYCKDESVPEKHRKKIMEILEEKLHHRMDVDNIYIHPSPEDYRMFFKPHFSLSPKKMADVVKSGFKAATDVLRHYEFEDLRDQPPIKGESPARARARKKAVS